MTAYIGVVDMARRNPGGGELLRVIGQAQNQREMDDVHSGRADFRDQPARFCSR